MRAGQFHPNLHPNFTQIGFQLIITQIFKLNQISTIHQRHEFSNRDHCLVPLDKQDPANRPHQAPRLLPAKGVRIDHDYLIPPRGLHRQSLPPEAVRGSPCLADETPTKEGMPRHPRVNSQEARGSPSAWRSCQTARPLSSGEGS